MGSGSGSGNDGPPGSMAGSDIWQAVSDRIVAGVCHDLSDRLSSLFGLLQLGELEGTVDPRLSGPLQTELGRVEELITLLRSLPGGRNEEPELIRPVDAISTVIELLRRYRGLEGLQVSVEATNDPLMRVRWTPLLQILLASAAAVGEVAWGQGITEIVVRIGDPPADAGPETTRRALWLEIAPTGAAPSMATSSGGPAIAVDTVAAIQAALERIGGILVHRGAGLYLGFDHDYAAEVTVPA